MTTPSTVSGTLKGSQAPRDGILFEGVHRRFGDRPVLRGLDLRVHPGQIHALLGRNGSGKTTALRILLGFLEPHAGRASVLGVDSRALGPDERGRIGYVSEEHRLYRSMRVGETIAFEAGTRPRFDRPLAEGALARCGLGSRLRVGQLSRGQRAQLALIIAVASGPDVLVLDDPALGLDVVMRRELLEVMIDLLAGRGLAVLFSSHFLDDVERVADRVSILHEGRLIVDATLDELKRRVEKRTWTAPAGVPVPAAPGLLHVERRLAGHDLTLLDFGREAEHALVAGGAVLGPPSRVRLEDLFVALTRGKEGRLVPLAEERREVAA
jgi:ABC-2 type transport system ATP-binding protein